jgi:hypothetical protein
MKIFDQKIEGSNTETIVLPRGDDKPPIVLIAQAILDDSSFNKLCPLPQPPKFTKPGNIVVQNTEDKTYKQQVQVYAQKRVAWMIIESLKMTPGLQWETVRLEDSETWLNVHEELALGFNAAEINYIIGKITAVNGLNEAKLEAARKEFFQMQSQQKESISQKIDLAITQSGVVAKD